VSSQLRRFAGERNDGAAADRLGARPLSRLDVGRAFREAAGAFRHGDDRIDVVDVFHLASGSTAVAVVDVTGRTAPAARHAALVKHALRGYASLGLGARDCVRALNRMCIDTGAGVGDEEFFAALFFAIVAPDRRSLTYVSAGHDAAYLIAALGERKFSATGPVIGLMDSDAGFDHVVVSLRPGDVVAAVTAGFAAARDASGRPLGSYAVIDIVHRNAARTAEREAAAIVAYACAYAAPPVRDDVGALVLKIMG
jgi:serine phosphatase RsbU (regulator of sigma subunit)